ncbi:hypothetical protein Tsubulata_040043 [Turnera subulata]|uniref:RING-type domain-containing protein n=1 Tax=Turnera subulata TaxID=218843 RepID=A0A9Q0JNZ2_9ROSI|nr:hypothetical protein Tsubulata_040043 [Turnera subulata]
MALPQHHQFQPLYYQPPPPQHQQPPPQEQSSNLRNFYTAIDAQIPPPVAYYNPTSLQDQTQHPPYVPPFHVVGFAPGPGPVGDGSDVGLELQWNYEVEPKRKRLKEQDFLENNSQISSVDFLQARSVSTGLGLSLDNTRVSCSGDSALLSLLADDIDGELLRQDAEIDRYLKLQVIISFFLEKLTLFLAKLLQEISCLTLHVEIGNVVHQPKVLLFFLLDLFRDSQGVVILCSYGDLGERLRQTILEKVQANQLQTISAVEDKVLRKLREKEAEVESINKKNMELEEQMEQLSVEAGAWQQRARYNENMINALKFNLQQVYAQSKDSKEGCGDSEVDDTASCCNGHAIDFHLLSKEDSDMKMTCKACKVNKVCMLLLPCKHLCLCKDCESKLSFCPVCQSSKFIGMEIYM